MGEVIAYCDPVRVVKEFANVLAPGGLLVCDFQSSRSVRFARTPAFGRAADIVLPGQARLTLLSDGVVEARAPDGELFGFERTCEISRLPASEIAARARQFGQEDDITVITLNWQSLAMAPAVSM